MPPALINQPELPDELLFTFRAFFELSSDRPIGMGGPGPIPFSSIDRYATRRRVDDADEFDHFIALIRAMDAAWLDRSANSSSAPDNPT